MTTDPPKLFIDPIDPDNQLPLDRYCDVVLQGGVVDGVVYPGFLVELARKFRFRSVGGTSVGAIAACLAVACEYRRRFNNSPEGFNEGLAKMPEKLSEVVDIPAGMTRIRSLFQPEPKLRPLFDFLVDWISDSQDEPLKKTKNAISAEDGVIQQSLNFSPTSILRTVGLVWKYFAPNFFEHLLTVLVSASICLGLWSVHRLLGGNGLTSLQDYFTQVQLGILVLPFVFCTAYFALAYICLPLLKIYQQIQCLIKTPGYGMCTGLSPGGTSDGTKPALIEWLYKGVQDAAGVPYDRPLTFSELWHAPCGPEPSFLGQTMKSLDLAVISSCLSHGRMYEIPNKDPSVKVFFRLSEFARYFPKEIIDHLRRVTKPIDLASVPDLSSRFSGRFMNTDPNKQKKITEQFDDLCDLFKGDKLLGNEFDVRELPNGDLPIVVAARMSFAVPVLFQALPLLGLDLEQDPEHIRLVRLWFSDGGIASNMPVQLFDKALPRWPTFAARVLNTSPKTGSGVGESFVPYLHFFNANDGLLDPQDQSAYTDPKPGLKQDWRSLGKFILAIYETAKNGGDRAFFRTPEVRGRMVKIYTNNRTRGALNLKLTGDSILELGCKTGVDAGKKLANVFLAQVPSPDFSWVDGWKDHRWVRMHTLINGLREYLQGFGYTVDHPFDDYSLLKQIQEATHIAPLASREPLTSDILTVGQANDLTQIVLAIANLEKLLSQLTLPQPYTPSPPSSLRFKPRT